MSSNKKPHEPRHYPAGSRLRDREGKLWLPLGTNNLYIPSGAKAAPAVAFNTLATERGPMIKVQDA